LIVDENLHLAHGANPALNVFDKQLPIVGAASGQENAATNKRYVSDPSRHVIHVPLSQQKPRAFATVMPARIGSERESLLEDGGITKDRLCKTCPRL